MSDKPSSEGATGGATDVGRPEQRDRLPPDRLRRRTQPVPSARPHRESRSGAGGGPGGRRQARRHGRGTDRPTCRAHLHGYLLAGGAPFRRGDHSRGRLPGGGSLRGGSLGVRPHDDRAHALRHPQGPQMARVEPSTISSCARLRQASSETVEGSLCSGDGASGSRAAPHVAAPPGRRGPLGTRAALGAGSR